MENKSPTSEELLYALILQSAQPKEQITIKAEFIQKVRDHLSAEHTFLFADKENGDVVIGAGYKPGTQSAKT